MRPGVDVELKESSRNEFADRRGNPICGGPGEHFIGLLKNIVLLEFAARTKRSRVARAEFF